MINELSIFMNILSLLCAAFVVYGFTYGKSSLELEIFFNVLILTLSSILILKAVLTWTNIFYWSGIALVICVDYFFFKSELNKIRLYFDRSLRKII